MSTASTQSLSPEQVSDEVLRLCRQAFPGIGEWWPFEVVGWQADLYCNGYLHCTLQVTHQRVALAVDPRVSDKPLWYRDTDLRLLAEHLDDLRDVLGWIALDMRKALDWSDPDWAADTGLVMLLPEGWFVESRQTRVALHAEAVASPLGVRTDLLLHDADGIVVFHSGAASRTEREAAARLWVIANVGASEVC